jgi:phosphatidate cytidylyltransferase
MAKSGTRVRIITGIVILAVLALAIWLGPVTRILFFYTLIWFGAREMSDALNRMGFRSTPWIARVLSAILSALFLVRNEIVFHLSAISIVLIGSMVLWLFKRMRVIDLFASLGICFYPCALFLGFCYLSVQPDEILYPVVITTLFATSFCDAFAYFFGRWFGRHKLCPSVSPNKTIEGSVSGTLLGTASSVLIWLILRGFAPVPLYVYVIASFFCTLTGQIGDLCASVIKRQSGIKDFSNLCPGHGGAIDRLDSFSFAMPTAFFILALFHAL